MISYTKLNNFREQENPHDIMLQRDLPHDEIFSRFLRKVQNFSTLVAHEGMRKQKNVRELLGLLYNVDYSEELFISELSFSIFNWRILERLILKEDDFDLSHVDKYT